MKRVLPHIWLQAIEFAGESLAQLLGDCDLAAGQEIPELSLDILAVELGRLVQKLFLSGDDLLDPEPRAHQEVDIVEVSGLFATQQGLDLLRDHLFESQRSQRVRRP